METNVNYFGQSSSYPMGVPALWEIHFGTPLVMSILAVVGGTLLTVVESGFDRIPLARRAGAFAENSEGWTEQMKNIETWLDEAELQAEEFRQLRTPYLLYD